MADQICSIADCDRPRGKSRGWCIRHYQIFRRHGDPLAVTRPYGIKTCTADGCDLPHKAGGYCNLHYKRVAIHGAEAPRFRAQVVDGRRICPQCKVDQPLSEWGAAGMCKPCNVAHVQAYYRPVVTEPATCAHCGQGFAANKRRRIFCSPECTAAGKHRRNTKHVQARRARQRGATVEDFGLDEIYERDGWICQLCDEPIDRRAAKPHPLSRSIDHIVPISRGGEHSRANTQAAHLGCNVRKGARLIVGVA